MGGSLKSQVKVNLIILMHHLKLFITYSRLDKSSQPTIMSKPSIMQYSLVSLRCNKRYKLILLPVEAKEDRIKIEPSVMSSCMTFYF